MVIPPKRNRRVATGYDKLLANFMGFVTLAATLSSVGTVPVAGLVLLLGVDRFMNEARAVVNLIGNGVATIAIARWDQALDMEKVRQVIREQRGESAPRITAPVHAVDGAKALS